MFTWWKRWRKRNASSNSGARPTGERSALLEYSLTAHTLTDVGCHRSVNEDCIHYVAPEEEAHTDRGALLLVADGMGGHAAGEVASRLAAWHVRNTYYHNPSRDPHEWLTAALQTANRVIYNVGTRTKSQAGMGTTCTALAVYQGHSYCAYVGDSRLYLLRAETLYRMSEDHSLIRELIKQGMITPEEALHHEDRHFVLRALGTHARVEVSTWPVPFPIRHNDRFVICSDGLHDLVDPATLQQIVQHHDPEGACQRLIAEARTQGGHDNISVGVLHVEPPPEVSSPTALSSTSTHAATSL